MERKEMVAQMQDCAFFLYQNREQEAYKILEHLLPWINNILVNIEDVTEKEIQLITGVTCFLKAYQKMDNLAMADLLCYVIAPHIA